MNYNKLDEVVHLRVPGGTMHQLEAIAQRKKVRGYSELCRRLVLNYIDRERKKAVAVE